MRYRNLAVLGSVLVCISATSASAVRDNRARGACSADAQRFCGGGGKGIVRASCLTSRIDELTPDCRAAVTRAKAKGGGRQKGADEDD